MPVSAGTFAELEELVCVRDSISFSQVYQQLTKQITQTLNNLHAPRIGREKSAECHRAHSESSKKSVERRVQKSWKALGYEYHHAPCSSPALNESNWLNSPLERSRAFSGQPGHCRVRISANQGFITEIIIPTSSTILACTVLPFAQMLITELQCAPPSHC